MFGMNPAQIGNLFGMIIFTFFMLILLLAGPQNVPHDFKPHYPEPKQPKEEEEDIETILQNMKSFEGD